MKILFWILAIASIPVGFFMSVVGYFSDGLGLYSNAFGKVTCIAAMLSLPVCIVFVVLGIVKLCKGNAKKAVSFVLVGLIYSGAALGLMMIDEGISYIRHSNAVEERKEELYGEGWNDAPAIEGIPALYQELLNEVYATVRDNNSEILMDFGLVGMSDYFGDASLDNLGFVLMDLNGDGVDEMLIGAVAPAEEGGTAIVGIYSDPENPFCFPSSYEGEVYYMYSGEAEGTYLVENSRTDTVWAIEPATESILDVSDYQGEALDPADRLEVELIPFSQYK